VDPLPKWTAASEGHGGVPAKERAVSDKRKAKQASGRGTTGGRASRDAVREQKRAEFSGDQKRSPLLWAIPLVLVAIAALVALVVVRGGGDERTYTAASATEGGSAVTIPVADVSNGAVHFYASDVGGTEVRYFVVKAADGSLKTAFDACEVCYRAKKGYTQEGNAVRCNNCGRVFPTDSIGVERGGCNPSPIKATTAGDTVTISADQIEAGVRFFQ
jgi:uncharacterized membrane protein